MPKILTYNSPPQVEKNLPKDNPFKIFYEWLNSQEKYTKFFILTVLLIVISTPFIVNNLLETRQKAEGPQGNSPVLTQPTVSITSPLNRTTLMRNSALTISASATDNVGIERVEFYVNGSLICTDTTIPYTCSWKVPGKPSTNYTISAKAYDTSSNTSVGFVNVSVGK